MAFTITENCSGCTACVKRCPEGAIHGVRAAVHAVDPRLCIECGACGMICPREAILDGAGTVVPRRRPKEVPVAQVDAELCSGCGLCEDICPFHALEVVGRAGDSDGFGIAAVDARRCIACRLCVSICIKEAIALGERHDRRAPASTSGVAREGEAADSGPS